MPLLAMSTDVANFFFAATILPMNTSDAVAFFGTKTKIAQLLGISKQAVSRWKNKVPLRQALLLEQASYGKLVAERPTLPTPKV